MKRLLVTVAIAASMLVAVPIANAGTDYVWCPDAGTCVVEESVSIGYCPNNQERVYRVRARMLKMHAPLSGFGHAAQMYNQVKVQAGSDFAESEFLTNGHWDAPNDNKWHTLLSVWSGDSVSSVRGEVTWMNADHGWWGGVSRRIFVWWGECKYRPL